MKRTGCKPPQIESETRYRQNRWQVVTGQQYHFDLRGPCWLAYGLAQLVFSLVIYLTYGLSCFKPLILRDDDIANKLREMIEAKHKQGEQ